MPLRDQILSLTRLYTGLRSRCMSIAVTPLCHGVPHLVLTRCSAPRPSSFPLRTLHLLGTVEAPAQGCDIEDNKQHERDKNCFHDDLLKSPCIANRSAAGGRKPHIPLEVVYLGLDQIINLFGIFDIS